jgi:NADPH-dependent stearoyl-CoA 9-desaturase
VTARPEHRSTRGTPDEHHRDRPDPAHNAAGTPSAPGRPDGPTDDTALMARTGLTAEQIEAIGEEFDAIRDRLLEDIGEEDARYIRNVVKAQRACEVTGRVLLYVPTKVTWLSRHASLAMSKILDNMEIGHNVMHGQYDFMNDPDIHSQSYEWDTAAPSEHWKLSHNFMHHTYTNIIGKDRDVGYGLLRMTEDQEWRPRDKFNPVYGVLLALLFQYGVAAHDLEIEKLNKKENSWDEVEDVARVIAIKTAKQDGKDYVLFPLLAGPYAPRPSPRQHGRQPDPQRLGVHDHLLRPLPRRDGDVLRGGGRAGVPGRVVRPADDRRRQRPGSRLFHIISGNLGHQIEHHLYPDLPSRRYAALSSEVKDICDRYDLPYNVGNLREQFGSVVRKIWRLRKPDGSGRARRARGRRPPRQGRADHPGPHQRHRDPARGVPRRGAQAAGASASSGRGRRARLTREGQRPFGCQTVLVSQKARIRRGPEAGMAASPARPPAGGRPA